MDSAEPLARGFFIGFIVAQFISGWFSGPLVVVVLLLYVFLGDVTRKVGKSIMARIPGVIMRRFMESTAPVVPVQEGGYDTLFNAFPPQPPPPSPFQNGSGKDFFTLA
jgi:hypothetical protein